ncbi:hypothetical protein FS749_016319 [Ceratobasidium sp. UAMH 11750]|nr:hypothetical protein FS749_016319 [Ceratobasidium sp. UAMH 11750]
MSETVYNFTVADTSPTLVYAPYVAADATTGGWASVCPTYVTNPSGQNSYICDPDSAHTTSSYKASLQFPFEGTGIYLIGNTTNSLGYDVTLDGVTFPGNPKPDVQLLYSAVGLKPGAHSITLTVRQPASSSDPGSVTFKQAVVSAGTGLAGASVTRNVLDDGDSRIVYGVPPGGNWTIENTYPQSVGPAGISSTTFHDSYWTDATATLNFQGTGVFAYGACYSHSRYAAYAASVDGAAESSFDGTVNLYSKDGIVKQRSGNCLRYFKTGLDGAKDHNLVLRVKEAGRLAVDWIEIVSVSGGKPSDDNSQSGSNQNGNTTTNTAPNAAAIAGGISGGVVLVLALLTLAICLRRRKRQQAQAEREKEVDESVSYTATPYNPDPQLQMPVHSFNTVPVTPPWPQPQSPGPEHFMLGAGGRRISVASSGAPLVSPGIASVHSGSSGPGWSSVRGSSYNNYSPGVETHGFKTMAGPGYGMAAPAGFNPSSAGSRSNMAVEAGGSSSRFDANSMRPSTMSPGPPAYDSGGYMTPPPGRVDGFKG